MAEDLAKLATALQKQLEATAAKSSAIQGKILEAANVVAKKAVPSLVFKGLLDTYMNAIKKSGSLTSARPATVKAIQSAEKTPTEASVKAAVGEMKKHVTELEKTKKADKAFAPFKKNLEEVIKKTEALI